MNGIRASSVECEANSTTCNIPDSSYGTVEVWCYKEMVVRPERVVTITHSCAYKTRHGVSLGSHFCNHSLDNSRQIACCSDSDYCNAHISLLHTPHDFSLSTEDPTISTTQLVSSRAPSKMEQSKNY